MRYHALAVDYDGTLAHDGVVEDATTAALERLKKSGRRLLMVTGRELGELFDVFPHVELFDLIVAENGALLYHPRTKEERVLSEAPPPSFVEELRRREISPLSAGRVIVATVDEHAQAMLSAIRDLGLELHVIFNKGSVMALPSGVNKATGLQVALAELGLSAHNVVGMGDAENDHAFLGACECAVAVANALPSLQERADLVTSGARGAGVVEVIDKLLADDLAEAAERLTRHRIQLGEREDGRAEGIEPYGAGVLICGTSGSGKSTLTTGLLERFAAAGNQFIIVDPEADYSELEFAVALGSAQQAPVVDEVMDVLRDPRRNVVINMLGCALEHRPSYFDQLLPRLLELRSKTGRPHWIVVDEAHHLLPASWQPSAKNLPAEMRGAVYISVHPGSVSLKVLETVNVLLAVGDEPARTIQGFCDIVRKPQPGIPAVEKLPTGDVVLWRIADNDAFVVHSEPPKTERKRHNRKYAEGNLGADRSFYFRGPEGKTNLKAQNLMLFLQIADGVDDETWEFHRGRGHYSVWFREQIKNPRLADEIEAIEKDNSSSPRASREAIRAAVESQYTLPADKPSGVVDKTAVE